MENPQIQYVLFLWCMLIWSVYLFISVIIDSMWWQWYWDLQPPQPIQQQPIEQQVSIDYIPPQQPTITDTKVDKNIPKQSDSWIDEDIQWSDCDRCYDEWGDCERCDNQ